MFGNKNGQLFYHETNHVLPKLKLCVFFVGKMSGSTSVGLNIFIILNSYYNYNYIYIKRSSNIDPAISKQFKVHYFRKFTSGKHSTFNIDSCQSSQECMFQQIHLKVKPCKAQRNCRKPKIYTSVPTRLYRPQLPC